MTTPGYNLYRSPANSDAIDYEMPVGFAASGVETIATNAGVTHAPLSFYWYGLRAVNCFGREEKNISRIWRVEFDAGGDLVLPIPNAPFDLMARPVSKTRTGLTWRYDPAGEAIVPNRFNIYIGGTFVGSVGYAAGIRTYQATVDHAFLAEHTFSVRAVSADEQEEAIGVSAQAAYDGTEPPAVTAVIVDTF